MKKEYDEMHSVINTLDQITESASQQPAESTRSLELRAQRAKPRVVRGVFEKVPRSGVLWVRYTDCDGHLRREKAGTKGDAIDLYRMRKADALRGKKLPEKTSAPHRTLLRNR